VVVDAPTTRPDRRLHRLLREEDPVRRRELDERQRRAARSKVGRVWRGAREAAQARQLGVLPGSTTGAHAGIESRAGRTTDERIRDEVRQRLTEEDDVGATGIAVGVEDGEVTLDGAVGEGRVAGLAEAIAIRCRGVVDVHNRLRVTREK
jgi:osmotically-inducible protein OsmY